MPGFLARFGVLPDSFASARGRVNLIGEHTDTSEGYVLPVAIARETRIELALRTDGVVRVASSAFTGDETFELGRETKRGTWIDYVQGTVQAFVRAVPAASTLRGFDALVTSDLPIGAGLASSAALEVALIRALCTALGVGLDPVAVARIGRAAEVDFVGMPSGIMDQMAATLATTDAALFLDTRSLAFEDVALPSSVELLVVDSGVTLALAAGEYATRREEVARAAYVLELRTLRDASDGDPRTTNGAITLLAPPLDRRARHVVSENRRVLATVKALRAGDEAALSALFQASHDSLRDDFEVTVPDVDRLVAIAQSDPDVIAARMTGGGFGGAIVALARKGKAAEAGARICASYASSGSARGTVVVP
ncbi:MAG: galactokinase [Myxococcales bacterium]|nr:galactokinase [Myxococcales bacterium]